MSNWSRTDYYRLENHESIVAEVADFRENLRKNYFVI